MAERQSQSFSTMSLQVGVSAASSVSLVLVRLEVFQPVLTLCIVSCPQQWLVSVLVFRPEGFHHNITETVIVMLSEYLGSYWLASTYRGVSLSESHLWISLYCQG